MYEIIIDRVLRPDEIIGRDPRPDDPQITVTEITRGVKFAVRDEVHLVKIGDQYEEYPAVISHIVYAPKKWWKFWEKKKQLGYIVTWEGKEK